MHEQHNPYASTPQSPTQSDSMASPAPKRKKRWVIGGAAALMLALAASCGGSDSADQGNDAISQGADAAASAAEGESSNPDSVNGGSDNNEDVPREFKNALSQAQNYVNSMPFSEAGLLDQLTSDYGGQFPLEAAQYAVENVEADWNAEALEAAENYQDVMPMSDADLYNQLTSEHGEKFTSEQAQYAMDNLGG